MVKNLYLYTYTIYEYTHKVMCKISVFPQNGKQKQIFFPVDLDSSDSKITCW